MTPADYWTYVLWPSLPILAAGFLGGIAFTLVVIWKARPKLDWLWSHPQSGLVLPGEHVVTQKASLQEIQQLSGKP